MRVERIDLDDWAAALPETGVEVFHLPEALSVLGDHASGSLELYGGFKGDQPIALLPVVVRRRAVGSTVLSPPPGLAVPRLGPILMPTSPKRRKQERVNREFTAAAIEAVGAESPTSLFRMVCSAAYADPRPYVWADFDVETVFTYHLDVGARSLGEIRDTFSKSLRREIRDAEALDLSIEMEGVGGARAVYEDTRARYEEQGRGFPMPWGYVRDLVSGLGDRFRVYVARDESGSFVGGITVLYSNDAAYFWQGGARSVHEGVSVNSLLHWRVIEDVKEDPPRPSVSTYDLMGANTERLCRYKSKFGADLVPYYTVETRGTPMEVAKRAYELVAR
jgi:hypothetical protein